MSAFVQANTNGRLHDAAEASLSPLNRGFLYGDAIYEVWRSYGGVLFGWAEHWERMTCSALAIGLNIPIGPEALLPEIKRTVAEFRKKLTYTGDVYVRLQVYRGEGEIGLSPEYADQAGYVILVKPVPELSERHLTEGLHLVTARRLHRNDPSALDPAWKTGNYLNNMLCLAEARERGADDVVILNRTGELTEAATANLAFVRGDEWITPPLSAGILAGVTRRLILAEVARRAGLRPVERSVLPDDLATMDEAMLLSSTKDVQPVGQIDEHRFRVGAESRSRVLKAAFEAYAAEHLSGREDLRV
ncbi:aminotransferase class IV [Actomonas aquatica]|uniref:branched-chain-amino-acid transaminase n=1 Tax=Actomonas aquatica TaxID=2866162 RepID=A0ABZ1CAU2_9BACT|nr:aminotransferase class IV [Opitutus sp. WL0086]WRQ88623.1 aminotransferase class IV [Opitutus sp. WL0086]